MPPDRKPAAHHFVPQCLLRRFTDTERRGGRLTAIDLRSGVSRRSPTNQVAVIDDFYRFRGIENENVMEETLGELVEGHGARALKALPLSGRQINNDTLGILLVFIATLFIRTPKFRRWYLAESARFTEQWLYSQSSNPALWQEYVRVKRSEGRTDVSEEEFEKIRQAFRPGAMRYEFPPEAHVRAIVDYSEDLCALLGERRWSTIRPSGGSGGFICSDNPVTLVWSEPGQRSTTMPIAPGFAHKLTEVFVPLGTNVGIIGRYDDMHLRESDVVTAALNSRVLAQADHEIYARDLDFAWIESSGRIRRGTDLPPTSSDTKDQRANNRGKRDGK